MRDFADILKEVTYKTARSGGAGGQHVNKVETKVQLSWHPAETAVLTEEEKKILIQSLGHLIDSSGHLQVTCQEKRSQWQNKKLAEEKLLHLVKNNITPKKKRKPTKKSKSQQEKRLKVKRIKSEHKQNRKKIKW